MLKYSENYICHFESKNKGADKHRRTDSCRKALNVSETRKQRKMKTTHFIFRPIKILKEKKQKQL